MYKIFIPFYGKIFVLVPFFVKDTMRGAEIRPNNIISIFFMISFSDIKYDTIFATPLKKALFQIQ